MKTRVEAPWWQPKTFHGNGGVEEFAHDSEPPSGSHTPLVKTTKKPTCGLTRVRRGVWKNGWTLPELRGQKLPVSVQPKTFHWNSADILAQAISCSNVHGVFPVHELSGFVLSKCQQPSFVVSLFSWHVSDGTNVPISPAPGSSSNMGSPDGSLPDLEGTGLRASTMEEKINLQLPLFVQNAARIENCVQTLAQTVAAQTTKSRNIEQIVGSGSRHFFGTKCSFWFQ